jgi:hypothetical protein
MTTMRHRCVLSALCLGLAFAGPAQAAGGAAKSGDVGRTAQRLTSAESYVPLPTIVIGVRVSGGGLGVMSVDLGLDVPDQKFRQQASATMPRLRDAMRAAASDYALVAYRAGSPPDPERIAMMLQTAVDRALGKPGAKVVLANILITTQI